MVYLLFFFSGMAALVYQVAWMKMLTVEFGSTVYAVSTVLSVFMSGLAIGSWLFGRRVDAGARPLVLYAVLEFLLGGYAVLFLLSIPAVHRLWVGIERTVHPSYESFSLVKFGVTFALLLIPTTLMGGTLPVLCKYLGAARRARGRRLGFLYSFNTLGAMAGSASISFIWILLLGVRGSLYMAVAINVVLGLGALGLHRWRGPFAHGEMEQEGDGSLLRSEVEGGEPARGRLAVPIAFVSGFVILACEVLWTRLFTNFLSGNALIFSTILVSVLTGLAVGGFAASMLGERVRNLAGLLGVSMLVGAGLLVAQVVRQSDIGGWFSAAYTAESPYAPFVMLFVVLAIPCSVLGVTFPVLLRWVGRSADTIGRDVGHLYAVNTAGSVMGSLVAGFVLLRLLGVNGSLLILAAVYASMAFFLFSSRRTRIAAGIVVVFVVGLLGSEDIRRSRYWFNGGFTTLQEIPRESTEFLEEGVTTTVGIFRTGAVQHLTVNGLIVAETAKHDLWDLLSKAHLPMLIHPDPRRVALVGLGAGISLGATETYDLETLDCIEISPEVVRACRRFEALNRRCLDDPRLELSVNDGRHFLMTTDTLYDVINVDPVDPPVCTLYTQDFFQVCHDRLDTGGLMVQWVPLFRLSPDNIRVVFNAFLNVFEHCTIWYNGTAALLVGSRGGPMEIDVERFVERTLDPRVQESLALVDSPDPWMLLAMFVGDASRFREVFPDPIPPNTDDRPYLEYTVLRSKKSMVPDEFWSVRMLGGFATHFEDYVMDGTFPDHYRVAFVRKREVTNAFVAGRLLLIQGRRDEAIELMTGAIREHQVTPAELRYLRSFYALGGG